MAEIPDHSIRSNSSCDDHSIRICADRGGTFCDLHACAVLLTLAAVAISNLCHSRSSYPDPEKVGSRKETVVKLRK